MRNGFQKRFQAPQGQLLEPPVRDGSRRRPWGGGSQKLLPAPENGSRAAQVQSRFFGIFGGFLYLDKTPANLSHYFTFSKNETLSLNI